MTNRRLKLSIVIAAVALICVGFGFAFHIRGQHEAAQREQRYQTLLGQYAADLKPGMKRAQVERYLQANQTQFRQMCCVANLRGSYVSLRGAGSDDLVKIGGESIPFICRGNNVYIAFEFNPKAPGEAPDTNDFDTLKKISIFHQLEGCL
jgi:hypothetical protein